MSAVRARDASVGGCLQASIEQRADGSVVLRSTEPLGPYPAQLTDWLEHWARVAPERSFVARRDAGGSWQHIRYAQMLERAQRIGQSLLDMGLSARAAGDPVGQQPEHLTLAKGAMWAGAVRAGVAGVLAAVQDHAKLKHILGTVTGLVFASDGAYGTRLPPCRPTRRWCWRR